MNDKYKILEKEIGIKEAAEGGKKFKIKIKGGEIDCSKEDYKKEGTKVKIKVDITEMDGDKESTATNHVSVKDKEVEGCIIKRGYLSDSVELPAELMTGVKLSEKILTPVEG
jgi:hypothetical protein